MVLARLRIELLQALEVELGSRISSFWRLRSRTPTTFNHAAAAHFARFKLS